MDHFISDREHAVLMASKRRNTKRYKWLYLVVAPIAGAAIIIGISWVTRDAHGPLYQPAEIKGAHEHDHRTP